MARVKILSADALLAEQQAYLSSRVRAGSRQLMTFEFWRFKAIILQKRPFEKQIFQPRLWFLTSHSILTFQLQYITCNQFQWPFYSKALLVTTKMKKSKRFWNPLNFFCDISFMVAPCDIQKKQKQNRKSSANFVRRSGRTWVRYGWQEWQVQVRVC